MHPVIKLVTILLSNRSFMEIRKKWSSLTLYTDPKEIEGTLNLSESETGFNLKRCYKECNVDDLSYLRKQLLGELNKGVERDKSCITIVGHPDGVCVVKVRVGTKTSGKRGGWRVYVLLFNTDNADYGIVVGVTMHANGDDNITPKQRDLLKRLVDSVEKELEK